MAVTKRRVQAEGLLVPFPASRDLFTDTKGFIEAHTVRTFGFEPGAEVDKVALSATRGVIGRPPEDEIKLMLAQTKFDYLVDIVQRGSPYFIILRSQEEMAINRALWKRGVHGEKVIVDLKEDRYLVEREGRSLNQLQSEEFDRLDRGATLDRIGDAIGTFHTLKVRFRSFGERCSFNAAKHGHPHAGNILLLPDGGVGVIDFDIAEAVRVMWGDFPSVTHAFSDDYDHMNTNLFRLIPTQKPVTDEERRRVFERVVSHYPGSKKIGPRLVDYAMRCQIY
jgi:hypothetical protein